MCVPNHKEERCALETNLSKGSIRRRSVLVAVITAVACSMGLTGLASGRDSNQARSQRPDPSSVNWLQFDFNAQHSGNNTDEKKIGRENVDRLHELYHVSLPDVADGAPVYLSNVQTLYGVMNVLYLTTKDGHIVALDAATGKIIWEHQYGPGTFKINNRYQPIYTTSSPAIDPDLKYVYSYGLDGYVHKYKVGDGEEIRSGGWPELCTLKPFNEKGSSALAVATAKDRTSYLYVTNGGYLGDRGDYQGHVTTINLSTGKQYVFNANCSNDAVHFVERPGKPDCSAVQSAIWARPGVIYDPATDRVYMATGNGTFDPKRHDWGDTIFSLKPNGTGVDGNPIDSYTPANHHFLNRADLDLGSTAPAILPTPTDCSIRNLAVQGGKDMKLRLVNLADLSGHHNSPGHVGGEIGKLIDVPQGGMVFTQPAVWVNPEDHSTWVFVATFGGLSALKLQVGQHGVPTLRLVWKNGDEGSSPIIANNVLYCAGSHDVRAFAPTTGKVLWQSRSIGRIHWESPIVVNGELYITDESGYLTAYGL